MKKNIILVIVLVAAILLVLWKVSLDNGKQDLSQDETVRALERLAGSEEQPLTLEQEQALRGLSGTESQKSEAQMKQEEEALRLLQAN